MSVAASPAKTRAVRGNRVDPPRRPVRGGIGSWELRNKDPGRHYVWAYKNSDDTGLEYYLQLGYIIETYSKDGVSTSREGTVGSPIERSGHVLMSIAAEDKASLDHYGLDGRGGMAAHEELMRVIVAPNKSSLLAEMKFSDGRPASDLMTVENQTTELGVE